MITRNHDNALITVHLQHFELNFFGEGLCLYARVYHNDFDDLFYLECGRRTKKYKRLSTAIRNFDRFISEAFYERAKELEAN